MSDRFFEAISVDIGYCKSPNCRSVHIQLLDADGTPRAQAVIACENVDQFTTDMREIRDRVLRGLVSVGRH
jgi:hypothetical protein